MTFAEVSRRRAGEVCAVLGWRPAEFWGATPEELAAVVEALSPPAAAPVDVAALMERFPDG